MVRLTVAYLAYYLLSAFWSDGLSWKSLPELIRVNLLLLLFLATTLHLAIEDPRFEERLFFWFALAAGASLIAVFGAVSVGLLPGKWRLIGFGLASQPIIGATLYGVALLLCAFVLLPRAGTWQERLLWLATLCLCVGFMLMASSRGPLLALAMTLVAGLAIADRRLAIAVMVIFAVAAGLGLLIGLHPIERLYERDPSGHFAIWQQTLTAIAEHPWFGYGSLVEISFAGKHGPVRSPHDLLLANQLYGGLPATLLLCTLLGIAAWQAWRAAQAGKSIYIVLLSFGLLASLFDSRTLVQNLGREWITLWLPLALLAAQQLRGQDPPGSHPLR